MTMIILLSMLMLCLATGMPPAYYAHRIGDLAALLSFKAAVEEDPENHLSSWQIPQNSQSPSSSSPCNWFGVSCNNIGRVTALDLSHCNISGPLRASALSNLDNLRTLNLSFNRFQGNISHLPRGLRVLDLSYNSVSDTAESLPSLLPPNLLHLNVSGNNFSGSFSLQSLLQHSPRLQVLDLSSNNLTGPVTAMAAPGTLPCSHLAILDLSANYLSGTIPPEISECGALRTLNLSSNEFTGPVPRSFNSLAMIETLDLSRNHLSGPIPPDLGSCCRTLTHLFLSTNNISGTIPPSLSACTLLRTLDLSSNNISGRFPDAVLGNLVSLERLILTSNFITGAFPGSVSACPRLQVVDFGSNFLSGQLPENICGPHSELAELRLPDNAISGGIPAGLQHCRRLRTVDLSINNISGGIPAEIGEVPNLERFIAWFNHLRGPIPPELGRCRRLKNVILNNNDLSGGIPKSLAGCTDLEWIALSSNRISGRIPAEFGQLRRLSILQLANNSLSGEIPAELGNCSSLLWLDLNNNRLSGEIPRRLGRQTNSQPMSGILAGDTLAFLRNVGNACSGVGGLVEFAGITPLRLLQVPTLKDCQFTRLYSGSALNDWTHYQSLEYLDLSYNSLTGPIPPELGDMAALQVLELAHNSLSGTLPDSLGKLRNLGVFEASHNNLSGPIPQSFSNLTFLVQIDLSNNNLSGEIPSRGQLSTLPASQYANNPLLCGVPLAACTVAGNFNPNTPDTGVPQKRAGIASWANSVVLGILVSMAFVCVLIIWAIAMRARQKEGEAAAILNSLHTSCNTTTWKLGKEKEPLSINVATFERPLRKLTFSTLIEATNGFCPDSLIGSGGFGEVFKATLRDGSTVAIKKLIRLSCQGDREFMAEMETLGKIKHANLVPLLGYCKIGEERLLVYEYMPHGSLEDMLHGRDDKAKSLLTWPVRKEIARGAARGLAFLHHNCIPHVIHRDMKSSNVLLDARLQARVSDFGMARLISALDTHLTISALAGTPGYVPPEYYQSIRCTAKGDVYSYGVLLLELATGKRPTDKDDFGDTNLVGWVRMHLAQGHEADVVDPVLAEHLDDVLAHVRVAMQCLDDVPARRPSMLQVVATFKALASANSDSSSPPAAPVTEAPAPR